MRSKTSSSIPPLWLAACAAVLFTTSAHALPDAQFVPVWDQFQSVIAGDMGKLEKVADDFAALLKQEPSNPVLMAYAGTTIAMKANTTMLPWKKMRYAEEGMAMLDKAVATLTPVHDSIFQHDTPVSLDVKMLVAKTFLNVPGFMNKGASGAHLLAEITSSPLMDKTPIAFQGLVWFTAGEVAAQEKRVGDARKHFTKVIDIKAQQADAARAQIAKL